MPKLPPRLKSHAFLLSAILLACVFFTSCANGEAASSSSTASSFVPIISSSAVSSQPEPLLPDRDIDFATLAEQNEDIVAWVEVPGTVIDYPVAYSDDNLYYLSHDLDGNYYVGGSIFLDMANSEKLQDPMVVLYGHFMPDESLFTQLHRYKDREYFEDHPTIKLFTPEHQFNYTVVASLIVDDRYIFYNPITGEFVDYQNSDDLQYFLDWIATPWDTNAIIDIDECTVDDDYLVLSTCTSLATSNDRFLVVAKLDSTI